MSTGRTEDARREVLRFLAGRNCLAHSVGAIARGVNREGWDFGEAEVLAALHSLLSGGYVRQIFGALGASATYQSTLDGELLIERGHA